MVLIAEPWSRYWDPIYERIRAINHLETAVGSSAPERADRIGDARAIAVEELDKIRLRLVRMYERPAAYMSMLHYTLGLVSFTLGVAGLVLNTTTSAMQSALWSIVRMT